MKLLKIRVICVLALGGSAVPWSEQECFNTVKMPLCCHCFKEGTVGKGVACFLALLGTSPDKHPETVRSKNGYRPLLHELLGKAGSPFNMALELRKTQEMSELRLWPAETRYAKCLVHGNPCRCV